MSAPPPRNTNRYPYYDLERAANKLLRASLRERGQGEYPCHSERWMSLRRRQEESAGGAVAPAAARLCPHLKALLEQLLRETPLPRTHRRVLELARDGASLTAIAREMGRPLSSVHRWYHEAGERLRERAGRGLCTLSQAALIAQVYREQTSPSLYQVERHCAPGQEDCARDGLCRHRWYLYQGRDGE